jgi:N utilization substance protein B
MQLLYTQDRDSSITDKDLFRFYRDNIQKSFELFLFSVYLFERICSFATGDLKKRKSKHLPSEHDKIFSDKLYTNDIISSISRNAYLQKLFEKYKFESKVNPDYARSIYEDFSKQESYKNYIQDIEGEISTIDMLLEVYRFFRQNENYNEMIEDSYYNWPDDKSLVVGSVKKFLKALPSDDDKLVDSYIPDDETVKEFGEELLRKSLERKDDIMKIIIPVLENWDHERLAIIDTLLLRLAICEMLDFPTIPAKVTLNEYVELAKQYSTAKSKEFVNGILDKLMKNLETEGKLNKLGRGLEER